MQLISHNSMNVTRIPDKLGTEICFNEPFISEPRLEHELVSMADFVKYVK